MNQLPPVRRSAPSPLPQTAAWEKPAGKWWVAGIIGGLLVLGGALAGLTGDSGNGDVAPAAITDAVDSDSAWSGTNALSTNGATPSGGHSTFEDRMSAGMAELGGTYTPPPISY